RGHFVQPASGRKLIEQLEDLSSPVGAFIRERCEVGPGYEVPTGDLYTAWRKWCEDKGWEPGILFLVLGASTRLRPNSRQNRFRTYLLSGETREGPRLTCCRRGTWERECRAGSPAGWPLASSARVNDPVALFPGRTRQDRSWEFRVVPR